jgi:hypothetical protein
MGSSTTCDVSWHHRPLTAARWARSTITVVLEVLGLAAVLGLVPAAIASVKGYSFWLWWFYGWMLFIVALPHSLLLRNRKNQVLSARSQGAAPGLWRGRGATTTGSSDDLPPAAPGTATPGEGQPDPARVGLALPSSPAGPGLAACPSCGEQIHRDTALCPFCGWVSPAG